MLLGAVALGAVVVGDLHDAAGYTNGTPDSIASLGNSITRAFNVDNSHLFDNPQYSWSTGSDASVQSHYFRILQSNPNVNLKNFNYAVSGAKMTQLNGQAANVNATPGGVEYVTIEMGGNDVCTTSEATMTEVATYRAQFQSAMDTLTIGFPIRRIFVASVPDVFHLWEILHTNTSAVGFWNAANICQSMLANPTSMMQADVDRRARVRQRNIDFNTQLAEVCALYPQCAFDNNAVFNSQFTVSDVSTVDFFHPSLTGQANLAAGTWAVYDVDDDGWSSGSEGTIGTDALDNCADHTTDSAWPADINNDGVSDITDIDALAAEFGNQAPPAPIRYDIAPDMLDQVVDITDIDRLAGLFGLSCLA